MLTRKKSSVDIWKKHRLFIKKDIRCSGYGAAVNSKIRFLQNFGKFSRGQEIRHYFAQKMSAWVPYSALLPDVKIMAESDGKAVLMKQGNIFWWTDTLGIEARDLPVELTLPYPNIRASEKNILNAVFDGSKVDYENSPLQVWISNDIAYIYETKSGHVKIHNPGTIDIPDGMFLKYYERFSDGILCNVSGKSNLKKKTVKIRCNAEDVAEISINGKNALWKKSDLRHVEISIPDVNISNDLKIKFK
jgi:hypothetical protein